MALPQQKKKEDIILDPAQFTVGAITQRQLDKREEMISAVEKEKEEKKTASAQEKLAAKAAQAQIRVDVEREKARIKEDAKLAADEEEARKKPLITKVNRYVQAFPNLQTIVPKINSKTSELELMEILKSIREELASTRSLYRLHNQANWLFAVIQETWKDGSAAPKWVPAPLRFDLRNMSAFYRQGMFDREVEPLLMELDIEYPWLGRSSLPVRCVETLFNVAVQTHVLNTMPDAKDAMAYEELPPKSVKMEGI